MVLAGPVAAGITMACHSFKRTYLVGFLLILLCASSGLSSPTHLQSTTAQRPCDPADLLCIDQPSHEAACKAAMPALARLKSREENLFSWLARAKKTVGLPDDHIEDGRDDLASLEFAATLLCVPLWQQQQHPSSITALHEEGAQSSSNPTSENNHASSVLDSNAGDASEHGGGESRTRTEGRSAKQQKRKEQPYQQEQHRFQEKQQLSSGNARVRREEPLGIVDAVCEVYQSAVAHCTYQDGAVLSRALRLEFRESKAPAGLDQSTTAGELSTVLSKIRPLVLSVVGRVAPSALQSILQTPADWTSIQEVHVSNLTSTSLVLNVFDSLSRLQEIRLSGNALRQVAWDSTTSSPIASQLLALYLSENQLTSLGQALFRDMHLLQYLHLQQNRISQLEANTFDSLTSLKVLQLQENHIALIEPSAFAGLSLMTELDLSDNPIQNLDASTFQAQTNLVRLVLKSLPLRTLPSDLFRKQKTLQDLVLIGSRIEWLPEGIFSRTTSLRQLDLYKNQLKKLNTTMFETLSHLTFLDLGENQLRTLSADDFLGLTALDTLYLDENLLTDIDEGAFRDLESLRVLWLHDNELSQLRPNVFRQLSRLAELDLGENRLSRMDTEDFFSGNPKLSFLSLAGNALTTITSHMLDQLSLLTRLHLQRNKLREVPSLAFEALQKLEVLDLSTNLIRSLTLNLPQLSTLRLSNNPLQDYPNVTSMPRLGALQLNNHRITSIDLTATLQLTQLHTLEIAGDREALRTPPQVWLRQGQDSHHLKQLRNLDLQHLVVPSDLFDLLQREQVALEKLGLGWPGLSEAVLPLRRVCSLLRPLVHDISLTNTGYREMSLCGPTNIRFESVFLQDNTNLQHVTIDVQLSQLNVSGCTVLRDLRISGAEVLDMSATGLSMSENMCDTWGSRALFARALVNTQLQDAVAERALENCLRNSQQTIVDLSQNAWFQDPTFLTDAVSTLPTVLSASGSTFATEGGRNLSVRASPLVFDLQASPVVCPLQLLSVRVRQDNSETVAPQLAYTLQCRCAEGYRLRNGRCRPLPKPYIAVVLGTVFGMIALQVLLFVGYRVYKRYANLRVEHDLHVQLLSERDREVMALKAVWEIDYGQLRRLGPISSGTYGDVWKAEWDTVIVAVKVLKQQMKLLNEDTIAEFEKEIDFLRQTRHPHVVRFFGAGTDPNDCPFLVLEFVELGSLRTLLDSRDLMAFIDRYELGQEASESADPKNGDMDFFLVTSSRTSSRSENAGLSMVSTRANGGVLTIWQLKQRLASDVACGMAFIHGLGHVHRDLKSGNVLVSSYLRAKITDFGTIREHLSAAQHGTASNGDMMYSNSAGMTLAMTAGVGTPMYMAPEALIGTRYDKQADIFSFGVLLWEIATQRMPDLIEQECGPGFRGPLLATLLRLLNTGKRLQFASQHNPQGQDVVTPSWYQELAYECMAQDASDRPSFPDLEKRLHLT
eukprot:m.204627 g.204627  ORF g.204627 m.204627 type:complete len:1456 (-) comp16886_c2_seq7:2216-6583(-)